MHKHLFLHFYTHTHTHTYTHVHTNIHIHSHPPTHIPSSNSESTRALMCGLHPSLTRVGLFRQSTVVLYSAIILEVLHNQKYLNEGLHDYLLYRLVLLTMLRAWWHYSQSCHTQNTYSTCYIGLKLSMPGIVLQIQSLIHICYLIVMNCWIFLYCLVIYHKHLFGEDTKYMLS